LKIAFDEHVPIDIAKALKALGGDRKLLRVSIVSARDYATSMRATSDVPWLQKFAKAGGKVVVSGDAKMRGRLHEQRALCEAGFMVFFLERKWNQLRSYDKCAMIIRWWPEILLKIEASQPGQFFQVPCTWNTTAMKEVTPPGILSRVRPIKRSTKALPPENAALTIRSRA
jgi:hypothetical protein